ncbi:hypothetical protein, partial [Nisaea sp.]
PTGNPEAQDGERGRASARAEDGRDDQDADKPENGRGFRDISDLNPQTVQTVMDGEDGLFRG